MRQYLAHLALVVKDYDEAITFYKEKLNFRLIVDLPYFSSFNKTSGSGSFRISSAF